jgi:hypothetical protein
MVEAWRQEDVSSHGAVLDLQMGGSRWETLPAATPVGGR